ncbi:hypothetical protein OAE12_01360 [bacterium]|nr:hypothetical protein [bacterium]
MRASVFVICLLLTNVLIGQNSALENLLWEEAGGRIDDTEDHGGQHEIIDDAKNGWKKCC